MSSASGSPPGSPPAGGKNNDDEGASQPAKNLADDLSDDDSELSDVDEAQFEDFDPTALALDRDEPRDVADEETVKLLGRHKRKRDEGVEADAGKKKKKEGRREKERKERKKREKKERVDDDFVQGEVMEGKRRQKDGPKERKKAVVEEVNEEDLTPEERKCEQRLETQVSNTVCRPKASTGSGNGRCAQEAQPGPTAQARRHRMHNYSSTRTFLTYHRTSSRPPTRRSQTYATAWRTQQPPMWMLGPPIHPGQRCTN